MDQAPSPRALLLRSKRSPHSVSRAGGTTARRGPPDWAKRTPAARSWHSQKTRVRACDKSQLQLLGDCQTISMNRNEFRCGRPSKRYIEGRTCGVSFSVGQTILSPRPNGRQAPLILAGTCELHLICLPFVRRCASGTPRTARPLPPFFEEACHDCAPSFRFHAARNPSRAQGCAAQLRD